MDLRSSRSRRVATVVLAVYLVALAGVAFLPLPGVQVVDSGRSVSWNLVLDRPDVLAGWEAQRNVLMTVPFGLLLPLVVRWRLEALVLACVGVTLVIETGQLLGSLAVGWAWRAFDVNDLLLNTVGGLLGLVVAGAALAVTRRRDPREPLRRRLSGTPVRRFVAGVFAAGVLVWAGVSTATAASHPPVYACDEPPVGEVTRLPYGVTAYAGPDGSLCVAAGGSSSSVLAGSRPETVFVLVSPEGTLQTGVARAGTDRARTDDGVEVETHAVPGSDLRVWSTLTP